VATTVASLLAEAIKQLHGIEGARLDASVLLAEVMKIGREQLIMYPEQLVSPSQQDVFQEFIARRAKKEPVAYIIGKKEFWSLDFIVTSDTLIPRPDSETLVEAIVQTRQDSNNLTIADMGTGTGCLLISLLKHLPMATGVGIDVSRAALMVARENAIRHEVNNRSIFIESDYWEAVTGSFDIIVSNPPYIPAGDLAGLMEEVKGYEPVGALVSGHDGMDAYRAILEKLPEKLNKKGMAVFEVGQGQAEPLSQMLIQCGLKEVEVRHDLAGIARCVMAKKL